MKPVWKQSNVQVSTLKEWDKNPRIIRGKKFEDLIDSVLKFGLAQPIVVNKDFTIISGHARLQALKEIEIRGGREPMALEVPCLVPDRLLAEKEVQELNIRFNKNIAGEWDNEALANFFDIEDLKSWGFENHDFGSFSFGKEEEQGKLNETSGGETKLYECPQCHHQWTPEKK